MAPPDLHGVYFNLSINSLCWAMGYAIGLPWGGWAVAQSSTMGYGFWLGLALSVAIAILQ